jgi:hypothetical protein
VPEASALEIPGFVARIRSSSFGASDPGHGDRSHMNRDDLLDLALRMRVSRDRWLIIERKADDALDEELDRRVEMTRLMILDSIDRVDQLIRKQGEAVAEALTG